MPAILTDKYRTFLASQFMLGLTSNLVSFYATVGRPAAWTDDNTPPSPVNDTQEVDYDYWRDILGAKRVTNTVAQYVVARQNWTANTIYDQYDDLDTALATKVYYVLDTTSVPYKVYKCVWNHNRGKSTVAPNVINTALTPQQTSDGYVWQYMYTIDSQNSNLFLTDQWMPVLSDNTIQANARTHAGVLPTTVPMVITSGGGGYNALLPITTTIKGDGGGASVTANGVQVTGGIVSQVVLATGGSGYTELTSVNVFQSGVSSQATVRAIIPPFPNHGYDPVKELSTRAVMLAVQFNEDESGQLTVTNKYRRVGLLINPTDTAGNVASLDFYRQTTDITISANTGVLLGADVITNITKTSAPTATVVDVVHVANNYIVRVTGVDPQGEGTPFTTGDTIKNLNSGVEATVSSVSNPQLTPYSGSIIWVNHRTPVQRGPSQLEEIKIVFPFN